MYVELKYMFSLFIISSVIIKSNITIISFVYKSLDDPNNAKRRHSCDLSSHAKYNNLPG